MNHNHIESIVAKKAGVNSPLVNSTKNADSSGDMFPPLLENLEVLHLGYNGISNMQQLELGRLVSLKALFLQGKFLYKFLYKFYFKGRRYRRRSTKISIDFAFKLYYREVFLHYLFTVSPANVSFFRVLFFSYLRIAFYIRSVKSKVHLSNLNMSA